MYRSADDRDVLGVPGLRYGERRRWHGVYGQRVKYVERDDPPIWSGPGIGRFPVVFGVLALTLLLALIPSTGPGNKQLLQRIAFAAGLGLCLATCILVSSCGVGSTPPTNATLTITGTSAGVSRTLPVSITVNH